MKTRFQKTEKREHIIACRIRHLLLAWLTATVGECILLPVSVRSMVGLQSLAAMSMPRLLIVTATVFALLEFASRSMRKRV